MKKEYMTAKEIAEQLGIISPEKKPHARAIAFILREMDITSQIVKKRRKYRAECKEIAREWLHQEELPPFLLDTKGRLMKVLYVPCKGGKPVYEEAI